MKYFVLQYDVVSGFAERRMTVREAHLKMVRDAHHRGHLVMAGALGDPVDAAMLVFRAESPESVEDFAREDPYVRSGLVTAWRVRPWAVVIGGDSEPPRAL
jgi:uncharacterized protein